jgi:ribose/xylose/arabinose/galactoside ABC-type transport system permease subunit
MKQLSIRERLERSNALRANVKKVYIYVFLVLIVAVFSVVKLGQVEFFGRGHFLNPSSVINMLRVSVPILTLSGAFTLLMISGYIDLSVGSAMSLSAVVYALMIRSGFGMPLSVALAIVLGMGMGGINGFLVMKLRITPVIATLVTLNLFKGIALLIVPFGVSAIKSAPGSSHARVDQFLRAQGRPLGMPWSFYVALFLIVSLVIVQRKTILGKYAAAIGGNRNAAELSGSAR